MLRQQKLGTFWDIKSIKKIGTQKNFNIKSCCHKSTIFLKEIGFIDINWIFHVEKVTLKLKSIKF